MPSLSSLAARLRATLRRPRAATGAPAGPMLVEPVGPLTDADVAEVRALLDEAAKRLKDD
ncbi:hypothetical protein [Demequina sp. NBRC 110057]|uniref:hypothetical protein n=1 Tax=Demequina sp. NBRC 110057 TaxID=1570346 RepID=UPI0009FD45B9|nr:hypothetical protein [Demequina sp. NBRC 110057]